MTGGALTSVERASPAARGRELRRGQAAAAVARTLWLYFVPAFASALVLRAAPSPATASGTWAASIAGIADEHRLATFAALFVVLGAVARYWAEWLPADEPAADATRKARTRSSLIVLLVATSAALGLRTFAGAYEVLSASMLPSLEPEDVVAGLRGALVGRRDASGVRPKRGDVIVFEKPRGLEGPSHMIKRVVGLPGDVISMNGPHVVINGWEVPTCDAGAYFYPLSTGGGIAGRIHVEFLGGGAYLTMVIPFEASWTEKYTVKPGELFVLGDNRSNSADSRAWNDGKGAGVAETSLVARATRRIASVRRNQQLDLGRLFRPFDLDVPLDGIDTAELRAGIAHCFSNRPKDTHPPGPHAP